MKNYSDIIDNESRIKEKSQLVDETIDESKLTQHEVIAKMFEALVNEIESLKKILFADLSVTNESKEKAEKISKIAFTLQTCLDTENGGDIAHNLHFLYRYIRYMSKRIQDNDDMNYVQPAFKVAQELKDAWSAMPKDKR
tara:strand:- start:429 stop:848 length:420 start_codon:yes stop_codon:yes gene_type:complete